MFDEITQSSSLNSVPTAPSISLDPEDKITIFSYDNSAEKTIAAIKNKKSIVFLYVPCRIYKWDVMVISGAHTKI